MDKKFLRVYLCITVILLLGAFVFGALYYNPDNYAFPDGHNFHRERSQNPYDERHKRYIRTDPSPQGESNAFLKKLIGGFCALLLLGYLFSICLKKLRVDAKAESVDLATAFRKISLESGRIEYELFVIAAKEWSIPEAQIDEDFKNYMATDVLPYYVVDIVRKNDDRANKSLKKEEEIKPSSRWDLVKALLLFPGCFVIPYVLVIILRPYFSHNF